MGTMTFKGKTMRSVDVDWKEFYYTNCPLISPSNVDQELGWVKEEFKKIKRRVQVPAFHHRERLVPAPAFPQPGQPDALWRLPPGYPRPGRRPPHPPDWDDAQVYEGGVMMVRAHDPIYKMSHLKGKKSPSPRA